MGRIKTKQIKRATRELFAEYSSELTENFEENKKKVNQFTILTSKKLRNAVAGYLTRLKKKNTEII